MVVRTHSQTQMFECSTSHTNLHMSSMLEQIPSKSQHCDSTPVERNNGIILKSEPPVCFAVLAVLKLFFTLSGSINSNFFLSPLHEALLLLLNASDNSKTTRRPRVHRDLHTDPRYARTCVPLTNSNSAPRVKKVAPFRSRPANTHATTYTLMYRTCSNEK